MKQTQLLFLGTCSCIPTPDDDTASYLLNEKIMIDTGWHATETLRRSHYTPKNISALFFTHLHHDHMMALPAVLYDRYRNNDAGCLHLYGPHTLVRAFEDAKRFLQVDVFWPEADDPEIHILKGGDIVETAGMLVRVLESDHAVPGLCYRFEDLQTQVSIGFTGDSAPQDAFVPFFSQCDVLVHEYSWGINRHIENKPRHSTIWDAAQTAQKAHVGMLCPVHGPSEQQQACDREINAIYQGAVHWPQANGRLVLSRK